MNKKGLNRNGHIIFSLLLIVLAYFLLKEFSSINIISTSFLVYIPFYLLGSIIVDRIERPGLISHRWILHSRTFLLIVIFILIPTTIFLGLKSRQWFYLTSFLAGHVTHIAGDFLTGRLPK